MPLSLHLPNRFYFMKESMGEHMPSLDKRVESPLSIKEKAQMIAQEREAIQVSGKWSGRVKTAIILGLTGLSLMAVSPRFSEAQGKAEKPIATMQDLQHAVDQVGARELEKLREAGKRMKQEVQTQMSGIEKRLTEMPKRVEQHLTAPAQSDASKNPKPVEGESLQQKYSREQKTEHVLEGRFGKAVRALRDELDRIQGRYKTDTRELKIAKETMERELLKYVAWFQETKRIPSSFDEGEARFLLPRAEKEITRLSDPKEVSRVDEQRQISERIEVLQKKFATRSRAESQELDQLRERARVLSNVPEDPDLKRLQQQFEETKKKGGASK